MMYAHLQIYQVGLLNYAQVFICQKYKKIKLKKVLETYYQWNHTTGKFKAKVFDKRNDST